MRRALLYFSDFPDAALEFLYRRPTTWKCQIWCRIFSYTQARHTIPALQNTSSRYCGKVWYHYSGRYESKLKHNELGQSLSGSRIERLRRSLGGCAAYMCFDQQTSALALSFSVYCWYVVCCLLLSLIERLIVLAPADFCFLFLSCLVCCCLTLLEDACSQSDKRS